MEARGKKRPLPMPLAAGDDDPRPPAGERRPRFPKGKKAKYRDPFGPAASGGNADDIDSLMNPELAARERARRRIRKAEDELQVGEVAGYEVRYEDSANFVDDGIRIEPFNLDQEREEGYFDQDGNFVEYERGNEIKDAWLDSVEVNTKYAGKVQEKTDNEEDFQDLSSDDIGKIKRNIANILQPGETIIQALKRLKSTSTDRSGKMPEGTKRIFDELTEAAMKLMENGDFNVYTDDRETFEREAEGFERLARARLGASGGASSENEVLKHEDIFSDTRENDQTTSSLWDVGPGPSVANVSTIPATSNDDDSNFDMFGDNDDNADVGQHSDVNPVGSGSNSGQVAPDTSGSLDTERATDGGLGSDYVYDPASGYYYSSSLGYYYDPTSGFYCSASTGTWYSFDEQTGTYKEIGGDGVKE